MGGHTISQSDPQASDETNGGDERTYPWIPRPTKGETVETSKTLCRTQSIYKNLICTGPSLLLGGRGQQGEEDQLFLDLTVDQIRENVNIQQEKWGRVRLTIKVLCLGKCRASDRFLSLRWEAAKNGDKCL